MRAAIPIQAFCVSIVVAVFAGGEIVAHLVQRWPGSPILWQLDAEVFGFLDAARNRGGGLSRLFSPHSLLIALALLAAVSVASAHRHRLLMAAASNMTFVCVVMVVYAFAAERIKAQTASLDPTMLATPSEGWLVATLLASACVGFAVSHHAYVARARALWRARRARSTQGVVAARQIGDSA